MKRTTKTIALLTAATAVTLPFGACANLGKDCEYLLTCVDWEGDTGGTGGDGGTGGAGDGDGDDTGGMGGGGSSGCDPVCEGAEPACKDATTCVECTAEETSACTGDTDICDTTENECVECLVPGDCDEPAEPMCEGNACAAGCTSNDDCLRFDDTKVCDMGSGACVGCTPATEEMDCGTKSCDPLTLTCGPYDRAAQGTCRPCVSDSDCVTNHHCVPMEYPEGTDREGGYCLEIAPPCNGEPYTVPILGRTSLSGVSGSSYCGINEDLATCEAVRALEDNWDCDSDTTGDGQCWPPSGTVADAVEIPGALCRTIGFTENRCTVACDVVTDCLSSGPAATCGPGTGQEPVTPDYCGGQDM